MDKTPGSQELFTSIGKFVYSWACLEAILDHIVLAIYTKYDDTSKKREMQRTLQAKITFLLHTATKIPNLAPYKNTLVGWAETIREASGFRHDVIHGFYFQEVAGEDFSMRGIRFDRKPHSLQNRAVKISIKKLEEEIKILIRLIEVGSPYPKLLRQAADEKKM